MANFHSNPLKHARTAVSVAQGLRDTADACGPQQMALRARLIVAATTIDVLTQLLLTAIAKRRTARPVREQEVRP